MKRTYYCVEMGAASYPANEIHAQERPFLDKQTNQSCYRVRAESRSEAISLVQNKLDSERFEAMQAQSD